MEAGHPWSVPLANVYDINRYVWQVMAHQRDLKLRLPWPGPLLLASLNRPSDVPL